MKCVQKPLRSPDGMMFCALQYLNALTMILNEHRIHFIVQLHTCTPSLICTILGAQEHEDYLQMSTGCVLSFVKPG